VSTTYGLVTLGFTHPRLDPSSGLAWPLLGGLPLYLFGMWLLTATTSRAALYLAAGATGTAVGSAYEVFVQTHPAVMRESWFPIFNTVGLTADALATAGYLLMVATFPDGRTPRRWQRILTIPIWSVLLVGPLLLLTSPHVVPPLYADLPRGQVPNPYAVPGLGGVAPWVEVLLLRPWAVAVLGMAAFYSRALFADPATRRQLRAMSWAVTAVIGSFLLWSLALATGAEGTPFATLLQALALASLVALPVAGIHGILRHGAYAVPEQGRGPLVVRSSSTLITLLYAIAVGTPAVVLANRLTVLGAVVLTVLLAVVLLPVRARLERAVRSSVFGDRDRHLALLSELGARLEHEVELDRVLSHLAEALRTGLDASWVLVRLVAADGAWASSPVGSAGEAVGAPVTGHDLRVGPAHIGRVEVGPRRRGVYSAAELTLLATVASQATTAVSNVRLTAQLADQLEELTASRARLITAQDAERRRIERDLHDGIQQEVVALIATLRLARNRLERGDLTPDLLVALQDQAREMLGDLRELAHGIHPQVLTDQGLVRAVEARTARFPMAVSVEAEEGLRRQRYQQDLEAVAFYTVSEALANAAKHSGATELRVRLSADEAVLRLEVSDDGVGFEPALRAAGGGLANIRDRVAAVGGTLAVESAAGRGSRLVVELPVTAAAATEVEQPAAERERVGA
jgi:signal transduction histidine kinase